MKKMRFVPYTIVLLIATILLGCNSSSKNDIRLSKTGYLVSPLDNNIEYQCGNKKEKLGKNGQFVCASFPVNFYINQKPLGYITSIHNDGYVFPEDIVQDQNVIGELIKLASR